MAWDGVMRRQEPREPFSRLFLYLPILPYYLFEPKYFKNLLLVDNISDVVESTVEEYAFKDSIKL